MDSVVHAPDQALPPHVDGLNAAYAVQEQQASPKRGVRMGLWVLLMLVLLNAALWFGYTRTLSVWGQNGDGLAHSNQASEKIVLLAPSKVKPQAPALVAAPTVVLTAAPSEKNSCMVWSFTNKTESKRADNRLAEQAWSGYATEQMDELPTYMAFVGPFANQKQTDAVLKTINSLKIKDYSLLPSGSIALGVVATPEAGKQLQQQLTNRGLKDVQLIERQGKNKLNRYRFDKMNAASLAALRQLSQDLGTLSECN